MTPAIRLSLFLLLIFNLPFNSSAQQEYLFSHLHTSDGLIAENVSAMQQDEKGFIWIGTINGLQRYDGHSFLTFQHKENDKNSLPTNTILSIKRDIKNRLWLVLNDNKVGYFNTSDFTFHQVPIRAPDNDLHTKDGRLFVDSLGSVIFVLSTTNIYTYNELHNEFSSEYNLFSIPQNWKPVWLYYNEQHNSYWVGCIEGLVKYNVQNKTLSYRNHNDDNDSVINALSYLQVVLNPFFDKEGKFWAVSWPLSTGLVITSYDTKKHIKQEWQNVVYSRNNGWYFEVANIYELKNGDVWFTGLNLFARYNKKLDTFDFFPNGLPGEFSLHYDAVNGMCEDREHNLWICSNQGLYRFNPDAQLFHTYFTKPFDKDTTYFPDVSGFAQLKNGVFVVSTWGNGLFAYDSSFKPVKQEFIEQGKKLIEVMDWGIMQRKNGDIWRAHQGALLYTYHASTNTTTMPIPEIFNHSTIRQIIEDINGDVWLGTQSGLVVKWNSQSNAFTAIQKFSCPIHRLYLDKKNNIWVCLRTDGVACIDRRTGKIIHRYTTDLAPGKKLMTAGANDIVQLNDSIFLIASAGVNVLNISNDSIRFINPQKKAFSNTVKALALDNDNVLWVGSASGIFSINMKTEVASTYDENDGLQPFSVNEASSYVKPDGKIAFGRNHDFIVFDPYKIKSGDANPPHVTISGFSVMNKSLLVDSLLNQSSIVFPHNQNSITIQFSTLTFQNQYSLYYTMEGLDKDFIPATGNEAVYAYLPPGNYTFKVFAQNANGLKSKQITSISFTIATPFWQAWWFYALLALVAIALLYWFDRARMKRRVALQLMRSNISDNLHAEVNSALQDINMMSEIATIKADKEPVQSKNYISEINYKSRDMITAMDDMLWSIEPANDTMEKFIARAKEFAASVSYHNNAVVKLQADKQAQLLKPDMRLRYELMLLYKLSLTWLVNEMNAPQVIAQLNYLNRQLQLNMFAEDVRSNIQQQEIINKRLKEKTQVTNVSTEIFSDEKGTAIIINIRT